MKDIKSVIGKGVSFFIRQSLWKKIGIVILFLVVIWSVISSFTNKNGQKYSVEAARRADITESVDESGVVKISAQTDIYSPTNGVIEELYVSNGAYVEPGDDLFKVKSTATQQEKQAAYASYLAAVATLNAAKSNREALQADMFAKWDTFKELAESDSYENEDGTPDYENRALPEFHIAEKQWLAAEQKYVDQEKVIAQAQAAVNSAWLEYQATQTTVVKSTAAGTVANLSVVHNDSVTASSGNAVSIPGVSRTSIKPVLTVADFSVIGVLLSLGESDINKIEPGDEAVIDVDPINNRKYKGFVSRVDEIGYDDGGVMKYDVFIIIQDRDNQLKAGMTADAEIVTEKLVNVLSVPNTAVKPYEGGKAVQVVNDKNELEFVPVIVGVRGEQRTQILEGITEGDEIVVSLTNEQVERPGLFGQ